MTERRDQPYPPKQLKMSVSKDAVTLLSDVSLADGYSLRGYSLGDEECWVALLKTGDVSNWDVRRFLSYILEPERTDGSRVVAMGDQLVAATFASQHDAVQKIGAIDYVVSRPDQRGNGLGRAVCVAVLRYLVDRDYKSVVLFTDDWRLPAINLYLSLGFIPEMTRDDMPSRWDAVKRQLGKGTT